MVVAPSSRKVVVIGGASGIGRAVATACAARGDAVFLADIDAAAAGRTAAEIGAVGAIACDVVDSDSVAAAADAAFERLGRADFLMHAAGVITSGRDSLGTPLLDQRWIIEVNLMGTIHVLATFAPRMCAQTTPSAIVVTGSEHSVGVPHIGSAAYTASKHAVLGYADVVRRELPTHVRLSVLCPGIVATDLWRSTEHRQDAFGGSKTVGSAARAMMDMGLPAAEVAAAVLRAVDTGQFVIMTHDHVIDEARERFDLVSEGASHVPDQGRRYSIEAVRAAARRGTP